MKNMPKPRNVEILKEKLSKTLKLLDDPQPGLITWREDVDDVLKDLLRFIISLGITAD
jgi:hypothetical protein